MTTIGPNSPTNALGIKLGDKHTVKQTSHHHDHDLHIQPLVEIFLV